MLKLLIWEKSIYLMSVSSSFETLTHCFLNKTYYLICGLVKKQKQKKHGGSYFNFGQWSPQSNDYFCKRNS